MGLFNRKKDVGHKSMTSEAASPIDRLKDVDQLVLDYVKAPSTDYSIMLTGAWLRIG